jgi:hypothetical protein
MRYAFLVLLVLALAAPAAAQVQVNIGISLPAPPPLVVVPGIASVQYAPSAPGNVFFYGNQYWIYAADGGWHVSRRFDGPWILVAPQFVPRPVLLVPVRYYHVPPGHWKQWQREAPPHWEHEWGNNWAEKRGWKDHGNTDHGWRHQEARASGPPGGGRGDRRGDGPGHEEHGKGHEHGNK